MERLHLLASPAGADIYEVRFEHAAVEFRLVLENGRIESAWFSQ